MNGSKNKVNKLLATAVSIVLHPIVMFICISIFLMNYYQLDALTFSKIFGFLIVSITSYVFFSVVISKTTDIEFTERRQRPPLLIVLIIGMLLAIYIANNLAPQLLTLMWKLLAVISILTLVSFFWKISFHAMFFSLTVFILARFISTDYLFLLILLPLLYWSRISLKKHHILQLIAGSLTSLLVWV